MAHDNDSTDDGRTRTDTLGRRRFIEATGAGAVMAGLAGCIPDGDTDGTPAPGDGTPTPTSGRVAAKTPSAMAPSAQSRPWTAGNCAVVVGVVVDICITCKPPFP